MNEELYEKLIQQIEDKMKRVIEEYNSKPNGSPLDLPFVDLGMMDSLRFALDCDTFDLDSHPKVISALKHGIDLGEVFWGTLVKADYAYDFNSEYPEYDEFLSAVENRYNLEVA